MTSASACAGVHWTCSSVRPVHRDGGATRQQAVPVELFGVRAGNATFGHRFMAPDALPLRAPAAYSRTLIARGKVLPAFEARRVNIRTQVESLAEQLGGSAVLDETLLDEVTALVEWPIALDGQFETRFLALPREVLIATLQEHQRCFAIEQRDGALLARFITVSNIESPQPELIRAGNERVVRPRLADAAFFWEQDRKGPLAARRPGLDSMTFQADLGSIGARVARTSALAGRPDRGTPPSRASAGRARSRAREVRSTHLHGRRELRNPVE